MANDPWVVFDYEVDMLKNMAALLGVGNADYAELSHHVRNAVVESAVLHARNLVDVLLSKWKSTDDIKLSDLVPASFQSPTLAALENAYADGKKPNSPCWAFNKMLAHSTKQRTDSYDYSRHLNDVVPLILTLVSEIESHRPK